MTNLSVSNGKQSFGSFGQVLHTFKCSEYICTGEEVLHTAHRRVIELFYIMLWRRSIKANWSCSSDSFKKKCSGLSPMSVMHRIRHSALKTYSGNRTAHQSISVIQMQQLQSTQQVQVKGGQIFAKVHRLKLKAYVNAHWLCFSFQTYEQDINI